MKVTTIFFDVGNTLLFRNLERLLSPLHERGIEVSPELIRDADHFARHTIDALPEGPDGDHVRLTFWDIYYRRLMEKLGVEDDALRAELVRLVGLSTNWDVMPAGTRELLERLRARFRLGVISNADGKIDQVLARRGLADCFESITDSGHVGCEKPDRRIFDAALESMQARPEESLYVGDIYSVDFAGARRAGMHALLMDAAGAYAASPYPRIERLAQIEQVLA